MGEVGEIEGEGEGLAEGVGDGLGDGSLAFTDGLLGEGNGAVIADT